MAKEKDVKSEKEKVLEATLSALENRYGTGTVMKMGDRGHVPVAAISTGALTLDAAIGIGGIPRGRVTEIFGPESAGKTTLTLHIIAEAQKAGGTAVFIDVEHALDPEYAKRLGVDIDEMYISQPDTGEQALEIAEQFVRSGAVDIVVVDSVAALVTQGELDNEMGESSVGVQARLMSQALRKLTSVIAKSNTSMVFTNQLREKIGVMFGSPETTPGGRALKFYASTRLDVRRIETLKKGTEAYGMRCRVKVVKNKMAAPFRQAEFDILFNKGISRFGCIADLAVEQNIIEKSGAWFSYGDRKLSQGRDALLALLEEDAALAEEITTKVKLGLGIGTTEVEAPADK